MLLNREAYQAALLARFRSELLASDSGHRPSRCEIQYYCGCVRSGTVRSSRVATLERRLMIYDAELGMVRTRKVKAG